MSHLFSLRERKVIERLKCMVGEVRGMKRLMKKLY